MPVVQEPTRIEDERIIKIRQLGRLDDLSCGDELPLSAGKGFLVEERCPWMVRRRTGPLKTTFAVEPLVGYPAEEGNQPRHLVEDLGGIPKREGLLGIEP